jgi:hypothetical protein
MKLATSELAPCLVADMDRKGRCGRVEQLLHMVVGEDDPWIGAQRPQGREGVAPFQWTIGLCVGTALIAAPPFNRCLRKLPGCTTRVALLAGWGDANRARR